jgi:hypothetical protein
MRKRYRVLVLAAFTAALIVPVGYALSLQPQTSATPIARISLVNTPAAAVVASPLTVPVTASGERDATASPLNDPSGAGQLLLVGTALFGLSALVRKAS